MNITNATRNRPTSIAPADRFRPTSPAPEQPSSHTPPSVADTVDLSEQKQFPKSWIGNWHGQLFVHDQSETPEKVAMSLKIQPIGPDRYTWHIKYGEQPTREYELAPVNKERGHWVIDEKNGILLDTFVRGGDLHDQFQVGNSRISTIYDLEGDSLQMERTSFSAQPMRRSESGGTEAYSFEVQGYQEAFLTRT